MQDQIIIRGAREHNLRDVSLQYTKVTDAGLEHLAGLANLQTLILNQTRVIPARLFGHKAETGGKVELLLLKRHDPHTWEALAKGKGLRPGLRLKLHASRLTNHELAGPQTTPQNSARISTETAGTVSVAAEGSLNGQAFRLSGRPRAARSAPISPGELRGRCGVGTSMPGPGSSSTSPACWILSQSAWLIRWWSSIELSRRTLRRCSENPDLFG